LTTPNAGATIDDDGVTAASLLAHLARQPNAVPTPLLLEDDSADVLHAPVVVVEMTIEEMCAAAVEKLGEVDEAAVLAASTKKAAKEKKRKAAPAGAPAQAGAGVQVAKKRGPKPGSKNKKTLEREAAAVAAAAAVTGVAAAP
jgi:hypothetical protein